MTRLHMQCEAYRQRESESESERGSGSERGSERGSESQSQSDCESAFRTRVSRSFGMRAMSGPLTNSEPHSA